MKRLELNDKMLCPENNTTLIAFRLQKVDYPAQAEICMVNDWAGVSLWLSAVGLQNLRDWCDDLLKELETK